MKQTEILAAITEWLILYSGLSTNPDILTDYPAIKAIPTASRTTAQQASWIEMNSHIIDFAQNGPRPTAPYITTHLDVTTRVGTTPYRAEPVLNAAPLVTMSGAFITGNSIAITLNGTALTAIPFTTDNATTYGLIEAALKAAAPGALVTTSPSAKTFGLYEAGVNYIILVSVTGGATQPTAVITYPYSKTDTTVYYIEKARMHLQAYGQGSNDYLQNLQQSLHKDDVIEYLKSKGLASLSETGIQDIHTLLDLSYEERFAWDVIFTEAQTFLDTLYDIASAPVTNVPAPDPA